MFWLGWLLLIICGGAIAYQDFKILLIHLLLILLYGGICITNYLLSETVYQFVENVIFCLCYFLLCFLVLVLFYFIKNRKPGGIIDQKIGWADVLLFLIVGFTIEPLFMIWFFTASFILSLVFHLIFSGNKKSVPLAGFIVIFYSIFLILKHFDSF
jgi:hypothetical protein